MAEEDTLCGWGNEAKVAYFLANADIIVPRRAEQLNLLIELLPFPADAPVRVLDLGAGYGAVTERILDHYPHASATCVDGSEAMVTEATKRLGRYEDRVRILKADLADRSWFGVLESSSKPGTEKSTSYDVAVSAIAIHHLTHQRKRELYREVFHLLDRNGIFLNNDVLATPPALKSRFEALNIAAIQEQERAHRGATRSRMQIEAEMREQLRLAGGRHQSHIAPLDEQLAWLREAGFTSVDCYWRYLDLGIFGGVKQP
jgi:SAM-dependent methyltransferase